MQDNSTLDMILNKVY